jgi:hypothetical protein
MLVARVGVEAMGDDHLRLGVHRRLRRQRRAVQFSKL